LNLPKMPSVRKMYSSIKGSNQNGMKNIANCYHEYSWFSKYERFGLVTSSQGFNIFSYRTNSTVNKGRNKDMKRDEYFKRSKSEKLPSKRCPIIGRCERYASTLLALSELDKYGRGKTLVDKLINAGYLTSDFDETKTEQIGEPFDAIITPTMCSFRNGCPEVSLFDNSTIFNFIPAKAITSGDWDDTHKRNQFGEDKNFKVNGTGHYSECPEFSNFIFNNVKKPRKLVPPKVFVYIMINKRNGYFKIGSSNNPKYREKTLQSEEPNIELVESWELPRKYETILHKKYSDQRIRGEWFDLTGKEINEIYAFLKTEQDER
jgi:hypothetical protein